MKAFVAAIAALLLFGAIVSYWELVLGAVLVGGLVYAVALGWRARQRRRAGKQRRESERQELLAERAQQQHEQYLAGDDAGVYGMYRPADPDRPRRSLRRLPSSPGEWRAGLVLHAGPRCCPTARHEICQQLGGGIGTTRLRKCSAASVRARISSSSPAAS